MAEQTRTGPARGVAALVLLAASFALLTVIARYLNSGFTITQQVYLRSAIAFGLGVAAFSRSIRWRVVVRTSAREWGVVLVRMVLLYVVGGVLFSKAATLAPVGDVSFIAALPFVSVFGLALRRVRATRARVLYVLGSAAGAALLSMSGGGLASAGRGDLLALIAMFCIGVNYIGRPWHDGSLNNAEITALTAGTGAICVALISLARGEGAPHLPHFTHLAHLAVGGNVSGNGSGGLLQWAAVIAGGALNVLNLFLINYAFEQVDPVRAGNLLTLECVWGLLFGLVFYAQVPSLRELAGGLVIVCCAVGLNSARDPEPAPAPPDPCPP